MRTLAVVLALVAAAGCSSDSPTVEPGATQAPKAGAIEAKGFVWTPESTTVSSGTKVTWTNADDATHTVTSGKPAAPGSDWSEAKLDGKGSTFSHTFDKAGTYAFFCNIHQSMVGTVIVQ